VGAAVERRARWFYRLRGYRILDANASAGGNELDIVLRRGRRLVFCEVKMKADGRFGDPLEMVGHTKRGRIRHAAEAWLGHHAELRELEIEFEVLAERAGRLERLRAAF
jgi:putative endonuclease